MKKLFSEFKAFISKGNIIDLSVAVIIGAAFGKIVSSLTKDIIMPVISLLIGEQGFENYKYIITAADEVNGTAENAIYYGVFIQNVIDFIIIAFVVFMFIKLVNKAREAAAKAQKETAEVVEVVEEIVEKAPKVEDLLTDIKHLLSDGFAKK